jgi:uncharacterized protein YbjQ (UPF0145 family)
MQLFFEYFQLILFLVLLAVGFFSGRLLERRHYASIRSREKALKKVLAFATRYPPNLVDAQECRLVCGTVVISSDYFKQFVASLRNLVGGRFRGYESLFDRARREAILRMKEEAKRAGFDLIVNVKFESTALSAGRQGGVPAFEIFAYGTAIRPARGMIG